MWEYREQFIDMVKKNQFVVLVGETASGKTTQVGACIDSFIVNFYWCCYDSIFVVLYTIHL